jgi:hypothetical protein
METKALIAIAAAARGRFLQKACIGYASQKIAIFLRFFIVRPFCLVPVRALSLVGMFG